MGGLSGNSLQPSISRTPNLFPTGANYARVDLSCELAIFVRGGTEDAPCLNYNSLPYERGVRLWDAPTGLDDTGFTRWLASWQDTAFRLHNGVALEKPTDTSNDYLVLTLQRFSHARNSVGLHEYRRIPLVLSRAAMRREGHTCACSRPGYGKIPNCEPVGRPHLRSARPDGRTGKCHDSEEERWRLEGADGLS